MRISLVTLGVEDLTTSRRFYEALGWSSESAPDDDVVFFQSGGMVFGLWDRRRLAEDSGVADAGGWGGVTLAHNLASADEVDQFIARARLAGAAIVRNPAPTFWGGYSGAFTDPDGHPLGGSPQPVLAHRCFWGHPPSARAGVTPARGVR